MNISYNTDEKPLKLPKYGRVVQTMIDRALNIGDRGRRQRFAEKIVTTMGLLNPQMKQMPNYKQTLWNHLAFMADYKLDIDYPYEIEKRDGNGRPHKLSYPGHKIRYKHYGHLLEQAIASLGKMNPKAADRDRMITAAAVRMKLNLADWKGDGVFDEKVARDLSAYTDGKVSADETVRLMDKVKKVIKRPTPNNRNYKRGRKG